MNSIVFISMSYVSGFECTAVVTVVCKPGRIPAIRTLTFCLRRQT